MCLSLSLGLNLSLSLSFGLSLGLWTYIVIYCVVWVRAGETGSYYFDPTSPGQETRKETRQRQGTRKQETREETRQGEIRQHETRRDKTRQDTQDLLLKTLPTRFRCRDSLVLTSYLQAKSSQDKMRQGKTGQVKVRQDETSQAKVRQNKTIPHVPNLECAACFDERRSQTYNMYRCSTRENDNTTRLTSIQDQDQHEEYD